VCIDLRVNTYNTLQDYTKYLLFLLNIMYIIYTIIPNNNSYIRVFKQSMHVISLFIVDQLSVNGTLTFNCIA